MQDTSIIESTKVFEEKISNNLEGINTQSRNYIKDIITLVNKEIGINKILSIILFGSQRAKSETAEVSDCDLLIIFKNRVSNHHIIEIEKYFIALEIKHKFREFNKKITKKILGVIQQTTGIFISHFLTKNKYWENARFHKIFRVNRVFSAVFAPRNIVLGNILTNSTILYGNDLREKIRPKIRISFIEMFKSTVMNLIISFFSIVISLRKKLDPTKYQLTAVKWALRASNFYCFRDSEKLGKITERFISFEKPRSQKKAQKFFTKFLKLRKNPHNDMNFMIRCPFRIIKIHLKAMIFKNVVKRKNEKRILPKFIEPVIPDHTFPLRF
ncbi:MAG: nucleotidyltransferase domain-containing protein [Promethearchaeota archaeon]